LSRYTDPIPSSGRLVGQPFRTLPDNEVSGFFPLIRPLRDSRWQRDGFQSGRMSFGSPNGHSAEEDLRGYACEFDSRASIERKIPADGQLGDAMHERPGRPDEGQQIAGREIPGLLRSGGALKQNRVGIVPGSLVLFMLLRGPRQIEHHQEMLRPANGKLHITATALLQSLHCRPAPLHAFPHRGGEPVEPLRGHLGQQFILAGEVAIRGVVRYTGAPRHLAQRESARADLGDQFYSGVQQGLAEMGAMVGLGIGHTTFLAEYVDSSNIGV
jgi:hypothetical protein